MQTHEFEEVKAAVLYDQILFGVDDFRECDSSGDVGDIAANGGILASDTTPIARGNAAKSSEIAWAAANADPIKVQVTLPVRSDGTSAVDGRQDVFLDLIVLTDNAGGGGIEAATFTVLSCWDGGTGVTDTATDSTPATTLHTTTATIAAADVPDAPRVLTLILTPGTHANDPTALMGARLRFRRRLAA